jgi:endo-1,4-beta-xylanase
MFYILYFLFFLFLVFSRISDTENQNNKETKIFSIAHSNIEQHRKTDFTLKFEGISENELKNIQIEAEQINHDFLFGCIIFDLVNHGKTLADEELFKERFKQLFNFAVFPFYWAGYEPQQGQANEAKMKEVAEWCIENGITTKGHPLAWTHTAGTPGWLKEYSAEESKMLLQQRIEKIVSGFKNHIEIWDVLNEVIHTVNWDVAMQENITGQDNRYVGRDFMSDDTGFIDSCFRWAHSANPDADLILNEFEIVYNKHSRQRFYDLLKALQQRNSPVKGIGIQAHEPYKGRVYYSPQQIWETFETYSDFNLPLHITELIPVSNGDSIMGGYRTGIWTEQVQAEFAEMIFTLSFGHPLIHSVNWWGFSDRNIWQPNGGLVDENLNPKPVYETLDRLINQEWKTKLSDLKLNSKGEVAFRGFKGDYQIRIKHKGKLIKTVDVNYNEITDEKKLVIINL